MAIEMGRKNKLRHTRLGFFDSEREFPRWGQLGCQGFIIFDSAGRCVRKTTPAFLQVRELAFQHVEAVLDAMLQERPIPRVCPGDVVVLDGLRSKAELNGRQVLCVGAPREGVNGYKRVPVMIGSAGNVISVKEENLRTTTSNENSWEYDNPEEST